MLRTFLFALAAGMFTLAGMSATAAEDGDIELRAEALPLNAEDAEQRRVGRLTYRGGVVLSSPEGRFGGISGLRWLGRDNRFLAVTDQGDWLRFDTVEEDGRLTGVASGRIGLLTDERGAPLISKALADAEALTLRLRDGMPVEAVVYFERLHRGQRYALDEAGEIEAATDPIELGSWTENLPANGGIEAAAGTRGGTWLIAEEGGAGPGRIVVRIQRPDVAAPLRLEADLPEPYRPTDAHALGDGRVLLLSRRYSPLEGVGARLDILTLRGEGQNARLVRSEVAELAPPLSVDNLEGLAVRRGNERTFVYVVSDDNFNALQRTLLMKFELLPPPAEAAAPRQGTERPKSPAANEESEHETSRANQRPER